jgi:hypothetical protein
MITTAVKAREATTGTNQRLPKLKITSTPTNSQACKRQHRHNVNSKQADGVVDVLFASFPFLV